MITKGAREILLSNQAINIIPIRLQEVGSIPIFISHHLIIQSPNHKQIRKRKLTAHLTSLKCEALDDTAEEDMTLISPCTGLGNSHPRKGHSRGEPFPPFSNSVGMEIERAWGNFTINQSSASPPRKQREAGSQMTNPFSSQSWNYCWGVMRDQREP